MLSTPPKTTSLLDHDFNSLNDIPISDNLGDNYGSTNLIDLDATDENKMVTIGSNCKRKRINKALNTRNTSN